MMTSIFLRSKILTLYKYILLEEKHVARAVNAAVNAALFLIF